MMRRFFVSIAVDETITISKLLFACNSKSVRMRLQHAKNLAKPTTPKRRKIKEEVRGFCTGAKFFSEMSAMVGTVADEFWSLSNERYRKRYL